MSWFERRTARAEQYGVEQLAAQKAASDISVSVVLPALDEAHTIGRVVDAVFRLADVLVDEIVVVDSGSDDGTAEIAVEHGARVHQADQLLPEFGPSLGKGDALWRSLTVTGGDIVVFLDTDISNPDPKFITGLLGPLLTQPRVHLVKAFYERPVKLERVQYATGGGRVTELAARPLLNLFWPELAGLVQPLSGEYAARRSLLASLPFFTGYGVEFGILIDTLRRVGADGIAQVDLECRVHRNQGLPALSRMAFGILQVAVQRLAEEGRAQPPEEIGGGVPYVQFEREGDEISVAAEQVSVVERPPLQTL